MADEALVAAWRRIAANDEGAPIIRVERSVLRALLEQIPTQPQQENSTHE